MADDLHGFRRLGEDEVFGGPLFTIGHVRFADPDGEEFDRFVVRHPGAVAVVPLHGDGTVTLVRQMRAAVGTALLEIPAGTCDVDGERPEATARRELAEEAGLEAGELVRLSAVYNSPGYSDQKTIVFLATDLRPCQSKPDGAEERWMSVEQIALGDLEQLVASGHLVDETTVLGLLLTRAHLDPAIRRPTGQEAERAGR